MQTANATPRHRTAVKARWTPLFVLLLPLLAGCPVYGTREQTAAECGPGAQAADNSDSSCQCKDLTALEVNEPIAGMDDGSVPRYGGTIRIHIDANLPSLNRILDSDAWLRRILHQDVYQSLIAYNNHTYKFEPLLATRWESNELGTEWTFHLRDGVKWHDGQPFTSRDVKFTFDAILNPNNRTEHVRSDWQDVLDPRAPYDAPDEKTFVLRLKKPLALFLPNLQDITILPAHIFSRGDFNSHPNHRQPVGTGPYRFREWNPDAIIFDKYPDYWGRPAYLDTLIYRVVTDRDTAFAMLKRGDIDFMPRLMPNMRTEGITPDIEKNFWLIDYLPSQYSFWIYNTTRPVFAEAQVRQAMTMLIDRKQIICEIYQCQAEQTTGPLPRSHPAYDKSIKPWPYDPAQAAQLLEKAGWIDRDGDGVREKEIDGKVVPFRFTFLMTQGSRRLEAIATVVQNAMRRVGVDMQLTKIDWSVFTDRLRKGDFDAAMLIWVLNHDNDLYGLFHSSAGQNYGKWKHPEAEPLLEQSRFILDETLRNLVFRRIHQIVHEEQPYTFLQGEAMSSLIRREYRGVYTSDNWYQEYDMWLNDPKLPEVPAAQRHPGHPAAPPLDAEGR